MALGADRRAVRRLMLRQSAWPIAIGLAVGLGGAMAVGPLLQSQLFGVAAFDLVTLTGVAALFGSVAMLASYVPARRATRVDPLIAIRTE
jgi:ABC-type antimicrobial peptide transport system permease subunit